MEIDALRSGILLSFYFFVSLPSFGSESFIITINERSVKIDAPLKMGKIYSVIVKNNSLSDLLGKFYSDGEDLKFVSVKSSSSKSVEFSHQSKKPVIFKILSPAFQELVLEAGKKPYEVPPVE